MKKQFFVVAGVAIGILGGVPKAFAWGPEGHAIIADIAEAHLTTAAQLQVTQLLALEKHNHLDQVSSWPDEVRAQRREAAPWHFVDIPLDATSYDAARDCGGGNYAVAKIVDFEKILANKSASPQERISDTFGAPAPLA